jgi:hypothetical protein
MPTVRKQHRQKKSRSKNSHKKRKSTMRGGAGLFDSDSLAAKYVSCTSADRHNLQSGNANLDLIQGAGSMPASYMKGGNGACPESGKLLNFKQYADIVAEKLSKESVPTMTGGGYAIDPAAEQIGGQPARVGYSDCCPMVSINGQLLKGANSQSICGQQMGGGRRKKSRGKKHGKKTSRKSSSLKKQQMGGDSVPALFPSESHNGPDGDFADKGEQLDYAAMQPFWGPNAR